MLTVSETKKKRIHIDATDATWLLAVFLVALCLRVAYVLQYRSCPFYGHEVMDPLYHKQWAQAVAAGQTFVEGPYFRAPLYPWLLGGIYWLFGQQDLAPRLAQAVLGAASCGLLFLIGRRTFGRTVGLLAGFAAATYWVFLYFAAELLIVTLISFLDLLLIWLLLRTADTRSPGLWVLNGVVLGLSAIARPNILLFAPAVLAWLAVIHRSSWRRAAGYGGCFAAGCALLILPITIRNWVAGRDFVAIASQGGVNFYIGNNPDSDGTVAVVPGTPGDWWGGYHASIARAEQAAGRKLKPSEVSRYYTGEALKFMREQPGAAFSLMARKLALFWSRWEISNNQPISFTTSAYTPIVRFLPLRFWLVGPLGFLGLLLTLGEPRRLFPLWGFVIVYMASVVAFFVTARYRVPVVHLLILTGSYAACWCVGAVRSRRWRPLTLAGIALLLIAPVVAYVPEGVEDREMAQGHMQAGVALAKQGKQADAEKMLTEAVTLWPGHVKSWYSLAHLMMLQRRHARAEECYVRTLALDPHYPGARNDLGVVLAEQGKLDAAIDQFALAAQSDPDSADVRGNLGAALVRAGRTEEGVPQLLQAMALDPPKAGMLIKTARQIGAQGRFAEAIRVLQAGIAQRPDHLQMLILLAKLLAACPDASLRDAPAAVRLAERASALTDRKDPIALDALAAAYFAAGQTQSAVATARRAADAAVRQGRLDLAQQIGERLRGYESATDAR